jgi:kynurenine formamidase
MRFEYYQHHMSRRHLLGGMAAAGAAVGLGGAMTGAAGAAPPQEDGFLPSGSTLSHVDDYDDHLDIENAENGNWWATTRARYGEDDQRGTLNEITPRKQAQALRLLQGGNRVVTHNLGHLLRNGVPGFAVYPPRRFSQRITVFGYEPDRDDFFSTDLRGFEGEDAWRAADRAEGPLGYLMHPGPVGANGVSYHEERFLEGGTYQLATQLDALGHYGYFEWYYNGYNAKEFATPTGLAKLGIENVGPILTRGLLIDVLGYKQAHGSLDVQVVNGNAMLNDTYRITVEDLVATMKWERIKRITPGDVVLIRTGWHHLAEDPETHDRYLAGEPGIYLREAKFLGDHRPAIIGSDTFGLELIPVSDPTGIVFPVHTELMPKRGIHIGEGIITDSLAEEGTHEFVYVYMPQHALGATAGNNSPIALTRG